MKNFQIKIGDKVFSGKLSVLTENKKKKNNNMLKEKNNFILSKELLPSYKN